MVEIVPNDRVLDISALDIDTELRLALVIFSTGNQYLPHPAILCQDLERLWAVCHAVGQAVPGLVVS